MCVLSISKFRRLRVERADGRVVQAGTVMQEKGFPKNTIVPRGVKYTREVLWSDALEWADNVGVKFVVEPEDIEPPAEWEKERSGLLADIGSKEEKISELLQTIRELSSADVPDGLLKKRQILSIAKPIDVICGIYFLISDDEIVYIGQSINVISRVASHKKDKEFDSFSYVEVPKDGLSLFEAAYIDAYKPKLNERFYPDVARLYRLGNGGGLDVPQ
jgi:hypothetical protein